MGDSTTITVRLKPQEKEQLARLSQRSKTSGWHGAVRRSRYPNKLPLEHALGAMQCLRGHAMKQTPDNGSAQP